MLHVYGRDWVHLKSFMKVDLTYAAVTHGPIIYPLRIHGTVVMRDHFQPIEIRFRCMWSGWTKKEVESTESSSHLTRVSPWNKKVTHCCGFRKPSVHPFDLYIFHQHFRRKKTLHLRLAWRCMWRRCVRHSKLNGPSPFGDVSVTGYVFHIFFSTFIYMFPFYLWNLQSQNISNMTSNI